MRVALCGLTLAAALAAAGCGSTPFDDPAHVVTWANTASAVALYAHAYEVNAFADGELTFSDATCPAASDDGGTAQVIGGCTDEEGTTWLGVATVIRGGDDRTLTFDGFGKISATGDEATLRGTIAMRHTGPAMHEFEMDLIHESETTLAESETTLEIEYAGSVEGGYLEATVWNGSGRVKRSGPVEPTGTVEATTTRETLDDELCSGQAASGETVLRIGEDVAVITYDGETDCDDDKAARWSLNGDDQGLIQNIVCSTKAPGLGARPPPLVALLSAVAFVVARRARRRS